MKSIRIFALAMLLMSGFFLPNHLQAQCPSVMGTGDPAVILMNIYGIPNLQQIIDKESTTIGPNLTGGIQIGAIFSPQFQLVSGAELSWSERSVDRISLAVPVVHTYRTFFLEIPLDMRMRLSHSKKDELHFILGAGLMMANVRETNDPETTDDEMLFHQLFGRIGFEHTIQVKKTFNILWGLLGKVDPIGLATEEYSELNGTYYVGLKLGIQLGL